MSRTAAHIKALTAAGELSQHWGSRPMMKQQEIRRRRKAERINRKLGR